MTAIQDQIDEILATLGTNPEGVYSNVKVRVDILEARINNPNVPVPIVTDQHYLDLNNGIITNRTSVPAIVGACYIDTSTLPSNRTVKYRCIIESSNASATYAAVMDLYDTDGVFGDPAPVTGSQIDNTSVTNPQLATMIEVDITSAFAGSFTGTFEARLWMATTSDTNIITCKSAQLIVEG